MCLSDVALQTPKGQNPCGNMHENEKHQVLVAAACYVIFGTVVPLVNKWILTAGGFPHVLPLVICHMLVTSGLQGTRESLVVRLSVIK